MSETVDVNRREFLKGGSAATLMTMIGGVEVLAQTDKAPDETKDVLKTKVGVIGLGRWGRELLDDLAKNEHAEVAAICDPNATALRRGGEAAPGAAKTEDYKTILGNKEIPAVIIATPTHQHKEIALAALKAGKHVYCEAPLANTIEDARQIALAAKAAPKYQIFQSGLQRRADKELLFLLPFIRSGALGQFVMARGQWHKKQSWRAAAASPERRKELNWRLYNETSTGLLGEIGIHQIDVATWFLNARPRAVTGFGSLVWWNRDRDDDDRDVYDTVHAMIEYPGGVRLEYDATLANSFEADYDVLYGSDAAVSLREGKGWMFKEVDSALFGWEPYATKETFYQESGIALVAGATKSAQADVKLTPKQKLEATSLYQALESFLLNAGDMARAVENARGTYGDDPDALAAAIASAKKRPGAGYVEGYEATVTALKANEAAVQGKRIELKKEWYELG